MCTSAQLAATSTLSGRCGSLTTTSGSFQRPLSYTTSPVHRSWSPWPSWAGVFCCSTISSSASRHEACGPAAKDSIHHTPALRGAANVSSLVSEPIRRQPSVGACTAAGSASLATRASTAGPSSSEAGTPGSRSTLIGYSTVSFPTRRVTSGSYAGTSQIAAGSSCGEITGIDVAGADVPAVVGTSVAGGVTGPGVVAPGPGVVPPRK